MEKVENGYKLLSNVNNITLSDDTGKIMACLAAMSDILNIATGYISEHYIRQDINDIIEDFYTAFSAFNDKIEQLLFLSLTQAMHESGYEEM